MINQNSVIFVLTIFAAISFLGIIDMRATNEYHSEYSKLRAKKRLVTGNVINVREIINGLEEKDERKNGYKKGRTLITVKIKANIFAPFVDIKIYEYSPILNKEKFVERLIALSFYEMKDFLEEYNFETNETDDESATLLIEGGQFECLYLKKD